MCSILLALSLSHFCLDLPVGSPVRVTMMDGQVVSGQVHERTTPDQVWLQVRGENSDLLLRVRRVEIAHWTVVSRSAAAAAAPATSQPQGEVARQLLFDTP